MKIVNLILAFLFFLFAAFQYNDSDSWIWMAIYLLVAYVSLSAFQMKYSKLVIYFGLAVCVIGMGLLFPDIIRWLRMGMPSITESMKAEKIHVELTREFFGLVICFVALVFHFFQMRRLEKTKL